MAMVAGAYQAGSERVVRSEAGSVTGSRSLIACCQQLADASSCAPA
jgi:hypothetical protein